MPPTHRGAPSRSLTKNRGEAPSSTTRRRDRPEPPGPGPPWPGPPWPAPPGPPGPAPRPP
ncbi:LytR family transcriptional regulator, partial [Cellulomonas hominis]